jgi:FkbM family methyltransferase
MRCMLIRAGTHDVLVYDQVVEKNEYDLPDRFEPIDQIIDLGAHVGAFAFACLNRGAKRLHCYEPDEGSFALMTCNMQAWADDEGIVLNLYQEAAWFEDAEAGLSKVDRYTASPRVMHQSEDDVFTIKATGIQTILDRVPGPIRMVKMDIEGSEVPVLNADADWSRVQEIIGEIHYGIDWIDHPAATNKWLFERLLALGFNEMKCEPSRYDYLFGEWSEGMAGQFRAVR